MLTETGEFIIAFSTSLNICKYSSVFSLSKSTKNKVNSCHVDDLLKHINVILCLKQCHIAQADYCYLVNRNCRTIGSIDRLIRQRAFGSI